MAGRRRAGAFGTLERRENRPPGSRKAEVVWRPVWACPACQTAADATHADAMRRAEAEGVEPPKRRRIQHKGRWTGSKAGAQVVLEEVRRERDAARIAGLPVTCWLDDHGDGTAGDVAVLGEPLSTYAERVLTRSEGAEQTRANDVKLWSERVLRPEVSSEPLGLGERFGHRPAHTISRQEVRTWLAETRQRTGRGGQPLSASQVRQRFYLLRRVIREAMDSDAISIDPTAGVRPPPQAQGRAVTGLLRAEQDRRWLPTTEQVQALCASVPHRSRLAIALLFGAGLRAGECTALEVGDLRQDSAGRWSVSITKSESQASPGRSRSAGKTGKAATRHLPAWLADLVVDHLRVLPDRAPGDRLFPSIGRLAAASLSHSAIRTDLTAACVANGWTPLTLQDLRAAGEASVAARLGRAEAAVWARHGLGVQLAHYVAQQHEEVSRAAAGV